MPTNTYGLPAYSLIIDPPSGWQFGFPKKFTFKPSSNSLSDEDYDQEFCQWLLDEGYPQSMIDQGMHKWCRYWAEN
jgi:hypothetical protein